MTALSQCLKERPRPNTSPAGRGGGDRQRQDAMHKLIKDFWRGYQIMGNEQSGESPRAQMIRDEKRADQEQKRIDEEAVFIGVINKKRMKIIRLCAWVIVAMCLCPPWLFVGEPHEVCGYGFLWAPATRPGSTDEANTVDMTRLLLQCLAVVIVGGVAFLDSYAQRPSSDCPRCVNARGAGSKFCNACGRRLIG
jgi:hypothetical protein